MLVQSESVDERRLAIIVTNDLHSHVVSFKNSTGIDVGGLDRISSCAKSVEARYYDTLLVSSGDDVSGNFFNTFQGIPEMTAMSRIGYDVATPGNHEFEYGLDDYRIALNGADGEIISSNLRFDDQVVNSTVHESGIKTLGNLKVGFFGLTTPDLPTLVKLDQRVTVLKDVINISRAMVAHLEGEGVDMIVALSHCGVDVDRSIAGNVSGIDLIVGGHDHINYHHVIESPDGWSTQIVQDGCFGEKLGVMSFRFGGGMEDVEWQQVPLTADVGSDPAILDYLAPYMAEYEHQFSKLIGNTTTALDARKIAIRHTETNLGNLVADAIQDAFPDADVAVFNSGSIRGDTVYPSGNISLMTVDSILPYANTVYLVKVTGAQLKQVLEISAASNRTSGDGWPGDRISDAAFLQVSGVRCTINTNATPFCALYNGSSVREIFHLGERVSQVHVMLEGVWTDLDLNATYTMATSDYLQAGSDGYYILGDIPTESKLFTSKAMQDILADYVRTHSPISPFVDHRILME